MQEGEIINRVAGSSLLTLDLEKYYPQGERIVWDMKEWLYEEVILKEKDFRARLSSFDWEEYKGKHVAIICSADAIVPTWAFMLAAIYLNEVALTVVMGNLETLELVLFKNSLDQLNPKEFEGARVVVKGCGHLSIPESVYVEIINRLQPVVASLMFGEPCSTVPLYKNKKK